MRLNPAALLAPDHASRVAIQRALACTADSAMARLEARRIYGTSRGRWKLVQTCSRMMLEVAEEFGITVERPTIERHGMVYGMVFMASGGQHLQPLYGNTAAEKIHE